MKQQFVQAIKVEFKNVASQAIKQMGYDKASRTAVVVFQSGGQYAYQKVSPITFGRWIHSQSKGRFFHRNIHGNYQYVKILTGNKGV